MRHIVCWIRAKKLFPWELRLGLSLLLWSFEGLDELQITGKEASKSKIATWS
jgi:hypothetical protein